MSFNMELTCNPKNPPCAISYYGKWEGRVGQGVDQMGRAQIYLYPDETAEVDSQFESFSVLSKDEQALRTKYFMDLAKKVDVGSREYLNVVNPPLTSVIYLQDPQMEKRIVRDGATITYPLVRRVTFAPAKDSEKYKALREEQKALLFLMEKDISQFFPNRAEK